jgi:hypothetical protein
MRPQEQSAGQPVTNLVEFFATDHIPFSITKQAKYTWSGDEGILL